MIAGAYLDGAQVVDIDAGDGAFWSSGCGTWRRVADASVNNRTPSQFPSGMVIVGRDIAPGVYRSGSLTTCYWERLSGFAGTDDQVIDADEVTGWAQITVTIEPTDVGFAAGGDCAGWTRVG